MLALDERWRRSVISRCVSDRFSDRLLLAPTFSCRLRGYLGWRADFARQRAAERAAARMERADGGTGRSHRHCAV